MLLLGAGDMAEGMAVAIGSAGDVDVVVANRTWDTAKALAARFDGRAVRLSDLPAELAQADVLLTSTGATNDHARARRPDDGDGSAATAGRC